VEDIDSINKYDELTEIEKETFIKARKDKGGYGY
jgi:hypothetical protein